MSTKTLSALKIRRILQITGHVNDIARSIDSAAAAATQVVLATKSDALNYLAGDKVKISDVDASEINTVGTDGNGNTGVVAGLTALANTYDDTQVIKLINRELLSDTEIKALIDDAVLQYSRDIPLEKKLEVVGNNEYEYGLPSDWINEFSIVDKVEYPAGEQIPNFIDQNEFEVVEKVDVTERTIDSASAAATQIVLSTATEAVFFKKGEIITISDADASETNQVAADGNTTTGVVTVKTALANTYDDTQVVKKKAFMRFLNNNPISSDYFAYYYRTKHTLTDTSADDTIPSIDLEAVNHLAASFCAMAIAAEFAKKQMSTIDADSIDFGAKSDQWQEIAKSNAKIYADHIGKGESGKSASGIIADLDSTFGWGRRWLHHGGRAR
ncbi:MAG: hypothetical protein ACYSRZ_07180 [Planctomycetota bacterium]|jgi:hypothetical protein